MQPTEEQLRRAIEEDETAPYRNARIVKHPVPPKRDRYPEWEEMMWELELDLRDAVSSPDEMLISDETLEALAEDVCARIDEVTR